VTVPRATKVMATGLVLAWAAAGCASSPAATGASAATCYQVAARAIQRHVTLTAVPPACRGLSQVDVNVAVARALRDAAAGVRGKVRQRQVIARDSPYVAGLIRAVAAAPGSPTGTAAAPSPPGGAAATPSGSPSRSALSLAALAAWLVTVGLGLTMMARWIIRSPRPRPGAGLNFAHLGLALAGLVVWISYLGTDLTSLAWVGCGLLLAVASLGMTLVFLGPATAAEPTAAEPTATEPTSAEPSRRGRPPVFVIAAHVTFATVTILLATLAAIGAG
jgi:hypothetical protein